MSLFFFVRVCAYGDCSRETNSKHEFLKFINNTHHHCTVNSFLFSAFVSFFPSFFIVV